MNGNDPTVFISKEGQPIEKSSMIFGVSLRSWMALMFVTTVCTTHLIICAGVVYDAIATGNFDKVGTLTTIGEPLYSLSVAVVSFYFGQSLKTGQQPKTT